MAKFGLTYQLVKYFYHLISVAYYKYYFVPLLAF